MLAARATGWTEQTIRHMPLRKLYQYIHVALIHEGAATDWHDTMTTPAQEHEHLKELIHHAVRPHHRTRTA